MRYFVLKNDERISDMPRPRDFFEKIDVWKVSAGSSGQIPYWTLIRIQPSKSTVFPEVLCSPVLLVTQDAQSIIKLYDQYITYRQVIYLDQEYAHTQLYFMPMLDSIDCLSPRSEYANKSRGAFSKVVITKAPISGRTIFQVKNPTQRVIVVRLDLVESLLACGYKGFALEEAEIED